MQMTIFLRKTVEFFDFINYIINENLFTIRKYLVMTLCLFFLLSNINHTNMFWINILKCRKDNSYKDFYV